MSDKINAEFLVGKKKNLNWVCDSGGEDIIFMSTGVPLSGKWKPSPT